MLHHNVMLFTPLVTKEDVKLLLVMHICYQKAWITIYS